jgi:hypothetical protein
MDPDFISARFARWAKIEESRPVESWIRLLFRVHRLFFSPFSSFRRGAYSLRLSGAPLRDPGSVWGLQQSLQV